MQKSSLPDNLVPVEFSNKFGGLTKAVLGGFDRLRLCGTLRPLFTPDCQRTVSLLSSFALSYRLALR
jgi:hypothetical protein